jgi:hypothetical protein
MASAAPVEINLMNVCNINREVYDRIKILDTVRQYEEYFASVKKPQVAETAAWYRDQHIASQQATLKWLSETVPWSGMIKPGGWADNCAQFGEQGLAGVNSRTRVLQRVTYLEVNALDDPEVQNELRRRNIQEQAERSPLVIRRLRYTPGPTFNDVELESRSSGLGGPLLPPDKPNIFGDSVATCASAQDADIPHGPDAQLGSPGFLRRFNMKEADYIAALKHTKAWQDITKQTVNLEDKIAQLNLDSAKIVYANQALAAADESMKTLDAIKRSFN